MKVLKRIKLRALLSRRHYSRYQRLNGDQDHDLEGLPHQRHHRYHQHHSSLSFFKNLSKKLCPLACMRAKAFSITHRSIDLFHPRRGVPRDVHKGCFAVYVGPEQKRFVMKTCYLEHPVFGFLLQKSREEFGFDYEGGLLIPCSVSVFESLLCAMKTKSKRAEETLSEGGELTRLIQSQCNIT